MRDVGATLPDRGAGEEVVLGVDGAVVVFFVGTETATLRTTAFLVGPEPKKFIIEGKKQPGKNAANECGVDSSLIKYITRNERRINAAIDMQSRHESFNWYGITK